MLGNRGQANGSGAATSDPFAFSAQRQAPKQGQRHPMVLGHKGQAKQNVIHNPFAGNNGSNAYNAYSQSED